MANGYLTTEDELRAIVPAPPARITLKIRPELEETGRTWIGSAGLVALATRRTDGLVDVVARARATGVADAPDDHRVRVSDDPAARIGDVERNLATEPFAGAIFLLPGLDSTIRANGAATASDGAIEMRPSEVYMHCPKAFVRAKLWGGTPRIDTEELAPETGERLGRGARRFVEHAPFLLLGTCAGTTGADVSPRGDPPGFVHVSDDDTLLVPDRPGNHILDSFRNLLAHPFAGLLFLIPGLDWTLRVTGEARLTDDAERLAPLAVQGKTPKVGIEVRVRESILAPAPALTAAGTWAAAARPPQVPTLGRTIIDQVEPRGRFRGIKGRILEKALERDVKTNLY